MMMMNKWMEFGTEYTKMMNDQLELTGSFWRAQLEQNETLVKQNMDMYFQHLQRNVEFLHETWNTTVKNNAELSEQYRGNMETLKKHFDAVCKETLQKVTPKTGKAGK